MSHVTLSLPARAPLALAISIALLPGAVLAADTVLGEVQVTAAGEAPATEGYQAFSSRSSTKTDTLLRDTPQSVSVVTSQQIKDQAVQSMAEAVRYTPGVTFAQGEGNRDALIIRGSQSTGDFFLDGVRDDVQYYRDLYNIDRIEVLRGSNALAFGRGGAGGIINRVSKEASWSPVREVSVSVGSYGHKRATLDMGQGLTETVAARVNLVTEDSDSYRQDVSLRRNGISPTLTLKPSDRTKVVVSGEFFNDLRTADRGIPSLNGKPLKTDSKTFFGNPDQSPTETTVNAVSVAVEHQFQNGVLLTNKTRYADYAKYYQNVFASNAVGAGTAGPGQFEVQGYYDETYRDNLFNQTDAVFKFKTGGISHQVLTGIELGRQDTESLRFDADMSAAAGFQKTTVANVATPSNVRAVSFSSLNRRYASEAEILGVYVQNQMTFSPKWQAVVGLRRDRFAIDYADQKSNTRFDSTTTEFSPRAALIFKPMEPVSIYASYSQTFVPRAGDQLGSLAAGIKSANSADFDPEEFINQEVGIKWDVSDSLSLTGALYRLERNNIASVVNGAGDRALVDGQVVKGGELGFSGKLSKQWSVVGGYAYADSQITEDPDLGGAIKAGNETGQTPRHTFSLWNRYDLNDRFGVGLGVISRSEMYALDDNRVSLPGYARVDAAAFYKASKNLDLQLNIENLTDREYLVNAHTNNNITPGSPIAARLSATYKF